MIGLFWLYVLMVPFFMGTLTLYLVRKKGVAYVASIGESYLLGGILCIGIGQVIHLMGVFLGRSLISCSALFLMITLLVAMGGAILLFVKWIKKDFPFSIKKVRNASFWYPLCFLLLLLVLLLYLYFAPTTVIKGDIMLETVQSFLAEDGIYMVNPLTGQEYERGMPLRYQILSLPTLYAMLCESFELPVGLLVNHLIPVIVLMASFLAYYRLSQSLFGEEYNKRYSFLIILGLLFWFGSFNVNLDGFMALQGAYLATSIRNLVLLPLGFAMAMDRKWIWCILCVLAEACITWTYMGAGVMIIVLLGMFILTWTENHWMEIVSKVRREK